MQCKACGGRLSFKNGLYICKSCNTSYSCEQVYENIDVFICYNETDTFGRRTADSIIANSIYDNLQAHNVYAFFARISADGLIGDDYKTAIDGALFRSKIVIILATSKDNFENLIIQYSEQLKDKKILPVFSGMNANDIPSQLKHLQALNYDKIGATNDIIKNVLILLNRSEEFDIVKQYNKSITRKRKLLAFLFSSLAVITIITIVYVVFFTPFVLSENKYQYAKELTSQNDYIEALNVFSEISDYKDTDNLMEQIYDLYNGYYERSDTDLTINFKKTDGEFSELTCTYKEGSFSSTVELKEGISEFEFRDSNNDQGSGTLKLTNTGISILIESESFNMIEASFSFDEKKDQIINTLDKSTLLSWLSGNVTIEKLQKDGYDFKFKEYVHAQFGKIYTSKDYPIEIFVSDNFHPNEPVTVISAPAGILAESHIGNSAEPFLEDGVIYAPYGTFPNSSDFAITNYQDNVSNMTINNDTPVYITTKYLVEYGAWERMLEKIQ